MNDIASRTPEGSPNRCPICGGRSIIEPSHATLDAPCPRCGHLLWFAKRFEVAPEMLANPEFLQQFGLDSLEAVELVFELESEFGIKISKSDAQQIHNIADVIRYIERSRDLSRVLRRLYESA